MKTPASSRPRSQRAAPDAIPLENIEALRWQAGIDDVELRETIRGLHVGDCVNLTFLVDRVAQAGPTLAVQIISIRGSNFRGKIAGKPAARSGLWLGQAVAFSIAHIHSVPRRRLRP